MLKLVPFQHAHLENFKGNKFGKDIQALLSVGNPECHKHTVLGHDDEPTALIFYKETEPDVFGAFFLISVEFKARDCPQLRDFVQQLIAERGNVRRVWTASRPLPELASWHEFLGLTREGTTELEGETYDVWSATWE